MLDLLAHLLRRGNANGTCTKATCTYIYSVYGYQPSLAATLLFLILFFASGLTYIYQGYKTKTWFFTIAMTLGCFSEVLGYVAKMLLWQDPFSDAGFKMSVTLLTFAPAFYAAGIYYTLKHICLTFSVELSRVRPIWYTRLFITCDVISILLQATGGVVASISWNKFILDIGDNIMITGLATQVVTLVIFGALAAEYGGKVYKHQHQLNQATAELRRSKMFKLFLMALWVAYFGILFRCCYRVAELCRGWGGQNYIMRNQALFVGLDSVPVAIASIVLNIWHPGWCFPKQAVGQDIMETSRSQPEKGGSGESSVEEVSQV
nr:hypothetical protein B0A51_12608 [Rachicladosporium sp. CCFEE 5018]